MKSLDQDSVKEFYNTHHECWPEDRFNKMTIDFIHNFILKAARVYTAGDTLLNAGSGGVVYPTAAALFHLDIAEKTIAHLPNAVVGSVMDMPFRGSQFDGAICVGSVINYCEAERAIPELGRVIRPGGGLVLEYERSGSGFAPKEGRNADAFLYHHTFFGEPHVTRLYSEKFIESLLRENGFIIQKRRRFNAIIPVVQPGFSGGAVSRVIALEPFCRNIPLLNRYSHNIIMRCVRAE